MAAMPLFRRAISGRYPGQAVVAHQLAAYPDDAWSERLVYPGGRSVARTVRSFQIEWRGIILQRLQRCERNPIRAVVDAMGRLLLAGISPRCKVCAIGIARLLPDGWVVDAK